MAASSLINVYYGRPMLPDVSRVLACLYEKEIDFKLVDMYDGQKMPLDALKLQTTEKAPLHVPALEDGATFLLESRNICRYLSEKYAKQGNRYLLGRDLLDRGFIEQWLKTEEQSFNPPSWELVFHLAFSPLTTEVDRVPDQPLLAHSEQALANVLDVYEHRLRESEFLACDEFSLADLSHLPNAHYIANSKEWSHLLDSRRNVMRWWEKISNRPSWAKVIEILNEVEDLKGANGVEGATCTRASVAPPIGSTVPASASQISLGTTSESISPTVLERKPSSVPQNVSKSTAESTISQSPNAPKSNHLASTNAESTASARFSSETGGKKTHAFSQEPKKSSSLITEPDAPGTLTSKPNPKLRSPPKQGPSTAGQPTSVPAESNLKKDAPLAHMKNSETQTTISKPDSGSSSATPGRPNSQVSGATKAKQE